MILTIKYLIIGFFDSVLQFLKIRKRPPGQSGGLLSPLLETLRIGHVSYHLIGKNILDCGCGRSRLLEMLGSNNIDYMGVDSDMALINYLKNKYHDSTFLCSDVHDIKSSTIDKKFDTIVLAALIEHINNRSEVLKNIKSLLKEDGFLIITTPNPSFEPVYHLAASMGIFDKHADDDHEELLTLDILTKELIYTGYDVIKKYHFLFGANQIIIAKKNKI